MKFSYKFSNLLGTVYRRGNLLFTPDGFRLISPVGNRLTIFDLKNHKSETLAAESDLNFVSLALSPDGNTLVAVNEEGRAYIISLISGTAIHDLPFNRPVHSVQFSPDGRKFLLARGNDILLFHAPGRTREFNPFHQERRFFGANDEIVHLDWTSDSRCFLAASRDMTVRVYAARRCRNLIVQTLAGHRDAPVAAFFERDSLDLISVCANGDVHVWESDTDLDDLLPWRGAPAAAAAAAAAGGTSGDRPATPAGGEVDADPPGTVAEPVDAQQGSPEAKRPKFEIVNYRRLARHTLRQTRSELEMDRFRRVTAVTYHRESRVLLSAFDDGSFFLHEMPDFNLIHSLSVSADAISTVALNAPGDWLALGSASGGQLLVWEWQSEVYVMKQQSHFNNLTSLSWSPTGQYLASAGQDGKVKLWNSDSGFCFVTFSEHTSAVTAVRFAPSGKFVVSCSLDGSVRAFDLVRYRNFRTLTSPTAVQWGCLALDVSSELVAAGGAADSFGVYVWSVQTGRLLQVLTGHESPVSAVEFSPVDALLVSSSWDKTVRIWDTFESKSARETLFLNKEVLSVAFRPDGKEFVASTLSGEMSVWLVHEARLVATIEGRPDLGYARHEADKVSSKKLAADKAFTTVCYSADGQFLLAGGRSRFVCIYSVADRLLLRKFQISVNRSLDGIQDFLDRRKLTEWGNLALVETDGDGGDGGGGGEIPLPGVRARARPGDPSLSSGRSWRPEIRVSSVRFSPTGRSWAAATTEGLLLYSLDQRVAFDPIGLGESITPAAVRASLAGRRHGDALLMALRLNEFGLFRETIEQIPLSSVETICAQPLADRLLRQLLDHLATLLHSSHHLHFGLTWLHSLLVSHADRLKARSADFQPSFTHLQRILSTSAEQLSKIYMHNKFALSFLLSNGDACGLGRSSGQSDSGSVDHASDEDQVLIS